MTWRAPCLRCPKPASFAGGAGTRPDHPISSEPATLVRAVTRGERPLSDDVAQALAADSLDPARSKLEQLGEREIEILRQLAAGATKEQIAANLNISTKTVQNYHYLIKAKTGLRTDALLVRLAVDGGLSDL